MDLLRWRAALLAALIARGTGTTLQAFAREALFEPLGITAFGWAEGRDGVASAASGLRLRPRDLLRIGALVLANGTMQPPPDRVAWLAGRLVQAGIATTGNLTGIEYGHLWYFGEATAPALRTAHIAGSPASAMAASGCG